MGFKPSGISQTTRFKRRLASSRPSSLKVPSDSGKRNLYSPSPSPTAAPFNSTSFLIRQKSQHGEEAPKSPVREQYGSNIMENMVACRSWAMDNRDPGCGYHESQAQHPMSKDIFELHLQLQGLQITDCADERLATHHQQPRSDSTSGVSMDLDHSSAARDQGAQVFEHRPNHQRVRSFTDDNFDLLPSVYVPTVFTYELLEDTDYRI